MSRSASRAVDAGRPPPHSPGLTLAVVTLLTAVAAGLGGMLLALLLHEIQHLAYGYSQAHAIGAESFLQGVTGTSPARRGAVVLLCGVVAGAGWWALYRFGRPLVGIAGTLKPGGKRMPAGATIVHALLQIVSVAMGSPLGREVAPREVGAVFATSLSKFAGLTADERRTMIACGAGAGLAAVYNVPLGGAVFVLEVLLCTFEWPVVIAALTTSSIAAVVAWIGLGDTLQYHVGAYAVDAHLLVLSALSGPLFGAAGHGFAQLTSRARAAAPRDWRLPAFALANFAALGLLAIPFPQLLGNGKGPAALSFDDHLGIGLAATLLALRVLITATTLRAGALGGLLTPGLANGALLAIVLGDAANRVWPGLESGAFALVGAAAFLSASMRMPLTALVLVLEFTHVNHDLAIPMLLAIAGASVTQRWMGAPRREAAADAGKRSDATRRQKAD